MNKYIEFDVPWTNIKETRLYTYEFHMIIQEFYLFFLVHFAYSTLILSIIEENNRSHIANAGKYI